MTTSLQPWTTFGDYWTQRNDRQSDHSEKNNQYSCVYRYFIHHQFKLTKGITFLDVCVIRYECDCITHEL